MIEDCKGGVQLHLFIQPKSSKNEVVGPHNGELKVKLTAPPVDGKANESVIQFFSNLLNIPKRDIQIIRGQVSRHKTLEITGLTAAELTKLLSL